MKGTQINRARMGMFAVLFHAIASFAKGAFGTHGYTPAGGSHKYRNRQGFSSVSAPRCHTQRKHYKGFAG